MKFPAKEQNTRFAQRIIKIRWLTTSTRILDKKSYSYKKFFETNSREVHHVEEDESYQRSFSDMTKQNTMTMIYCNYGFCSDFQYIHTCPKVKSLLLNKNLRCNLRIWINDDSNPLYLNKRRMPSSSK